MPDPNRIKKGPEIVHERAAGIDIGSRFHVAAIPGHYDEQPVRKFSSFTGDLKRLRDWLCHHNINTVAMESTGIYWIPVHEILEQAGINVFLSLIHI